VATHPFVDKISLVARSSHSQEVCEAKGGPQRKFARGGGRGGGWAAVLTGVLGAEGKQFGMIVHFRRAEEEGKKEEMSSSHKRGNSKQKTY